MATKHPLFGSAQRTATENSVGMDVRNYLTVDLYLDVTAFVSGTLDVTIESGPDNSTWFAFPTPVAFAQAVGTTTELLSLAGNLGAFIRGVATMGGAPDMTFSLIAVAKA